MPVVTCPKCTSRYDPGLDEASEVIAELGNASLKIVCPVCRQWLRWPEMQPIAAPKIPKDKLDEIVAESRLVTAQPRRGTADPDRPRSRRKEHETYADEAFLMSGGGPLASNPGRLRVQTFRWIRHKPLWPLLWAGLFAASLVLPIVLHWSLWFVVATLLVCNIFYWLVVRGTYWSGDANASMIVDVDPVLIAVATDLTKGRGCYPVLKIFEARLDEIDGNVPEIGDRLATVATYSSDGDTREHWSDFSPNPAQYATNDEDELAELMESFGREHWAFLREMLRDVPQPYEPGLYKFGGDWNRKKRRARREE